MEKKLKKLVLKKEEIVNLNDYEMNVMRGGTGSVCETISIATVVSGLIIAGYTLGKEESWWNCGKSKEKDCMSDISENVMWYTGEGMCGMGDSIVVHGV